MRHCRGRMWESRNDCLEVDNGMLSLEMWQRWHGICSSETTVVFFCGTQHQPVKGAKGICVVGAESGSSKASRLLSLGVAGAAKGWEVLQKRNPHAAEQVLPPSHPQSLRYLFLLCNVMMNSLKH